MKALLFANFLVFLISSFLFTLSRLIKRPLYGLILVMGTMPLDQRFSLKLPIGNLSFSNIFLFLTIIALSLHLVFNQDKKKTSPIICFLWFWYIISIFWGMDSASFRILVTIIAAFCYFFATQEITRSQKGLIFLCKSYVWISFFQALIAIGLYLLFFLSGVRFGIFDSLISGNFVPRATGLHLDPNYLGISLFMGFALSISFLFSKRTGFLFYIIPLTIITAVLLTFSRTAWAGAAIIIIIFLVNKFIKSYELKKLALAIVSIAALAVTLFLPIFVDSFSVAKAFVESTDRSISPRYTTFIEALEIISEHPLFGVGNVNATEKYTHNTFLLIGLRSGLFGMIPALLIVFSPIFLFFRAAKYRNKFFENLLVGSFAGLLSTILGALTMGIEGHKMLWISVSLSYLTIDLFYPHQTRRYFLIARNFQKNDEMRKGNRYSASVYIRERKIPPSRGL